LLLAELRLGSSIVRTAANDVRGALVDARRGSDALAVAPRGRSRDLVTTRVQRQLAHLLSHAGDYVGAAAAAEATGRNAARVGDPAEVAWATYTAASSTGSPVDSMRPSTRSRAPSSASASTAPRAGAPR